MQIQINVVGKIATAVGDPYIVCGNSSDTILFTFDSEWKSYATKTARFIYEIDGKEKFTDVAFTGTTCRIPDFYNIKKVDIGVYAGDMLSTTRCKINCKSSILDGEGSEEGNAHDEPGEDIYNQIVGICNEAVTAANEATAAAAGFEATTRATFGNALKGSIYGAAVRADDVSPVEHALACKVESKNLFNTIDDYFNSAGATHICGGGTLTINGYYATKYITLDGGKTYTLSFKSTTTGDYGGGIQISALNKLEAVRLYTSGSALSQTVTFTVPKGLSKVQFVFFGSGGVTTATSATYTDIMLEFGDTATEYTPYIDPSTATVTRCGKNLLPYPFTDITINMNGITFTDNGDGTFVLNGTATGNCAYLLLDKANLYLKGKFTFSGVKGGAVDKFYLQAVIDGVYQDIVADGTKTFEFDGFLSRIGFYVKAGAVFNNVIFQPQIEYGDTATYFEEYKGDTYTPNADGTVEGITSLSPTMTLLTDTANTIISCEYNRDINTVIADLYNKITG